MNQQEVPASPRVGRPPKRMHVNHLSTDEVGVDVPYLRLRGWWLHHAGFTIGRNLTVEVSEGKVLIEAC
jgi:hypothetical protein